MHKMLAVLALACAFAAPAQAQKQPDPKAIQEIFDCLSAGLPADWKKAWVVVTEVAEAGKERSFEGKFFYTTSATDNAGRPLATCSAQQIAKNVYALSAGLPAEERRWKGAKLTFTSEGKFDLHYDYGN
jgi:hypothetical protein